MKVSLTDAGKRFNRDWIFRHLNYTFEKGNSYAIVGPNGSGKSTVINYVRNVKVNNKPIDFGSYINADDIAVLLRSGTFTFDSYNIKVANKEFQEIALASGLINDEFSEKFIQNM